ncbi:hypothetical protein LOTGIDRAFT_233688 [Lottia gigantea]|uniref:Glutamyl-tRNA(Gln) amidotransferase subunit B, mitochondrial n=1 Tax=Lottia gigantea TaxID=225164 RepID=V4A6M6_LOTGI|nr:hypothetical protein LOTGIDRAFT_233688 [Lottia gigantea]ESO90680.1 hypothetical protein LOTGIDRAFT_233688 [Lottia gigantea]
MQPFDWIVRHCIRPISALDCQQFKSVVNHCMRSLQKSTEWESVIGLEIHAQILSDSKLFSGSGTKFAAPVNSQVSLFDCAIPGTLPVLNRRCVEAGVLTALALKCKINNVSKFDRKHYFYADLPTGYQITQQREPLAINGKVDFIVFDKKKSKLPYTKTVQLIQLQLEQDSGKSLHDDQGGKSLIDLNRAGVGLMEIVTAPDFTSGEEAAGFIKELHKILTMIETCDGKMAEGSLRVDANVSINRPGEELGTRTEVKNLNSIRAVARAIEYEIERQKEEMEKGNEIVKETRTFDTVTGETIVMRDKETVLDYRFMPEPNLPPVHVYSSQDLPDSIPSDRVVLIDKLKEQIPELLSEKRKRLQEQYNIPLVLTYNIVNDDEFLQFFEELAETGQAEPRIIAAFVSDFLLYFLKKLEINISDIKREYILDLCQLVEKRLITRETRNILFERMIIEDRKPSDMVQEDNLEIIQDVDELTELCIQVLDENPKFVRKYKNSLTKGKERAFKNLGYKMEELTGGRAIFGAWSGILKTLLEERIKD